MSTTLAEPPPSARRTGEDFIIGICGFVTSLVTAVILWQVEQHSGYAIYSFMLWFLIPAGAIMAGFAGASGYLGGSWLLGHRMTSLQLVNIVLASVATFFLIHYLSYISLEFQGKQVSTYITFLQYLDLATKSMSMGSLKHPERGSTGPLGNAGYVIAILQVIGFAVGGFCVWAYLLGKPFCAACSRYLKAKGKAVRYTSDAEGLLTNNSQVTQHIAGNAIATAINQLKSFGTTSAEEHQHLRAVCHVRLCRKCDRHWVQFMIEKKSGDRWNEITELTVRGFTNQVVDA